jgi:hypothetical protein
VVRPMPKTKRAICAHSKHASVQHLAAPTPSTCAWRPCRALDSP